jgi:hypothetical protein
MEHPKDEIFSGKELIKMFDKLVSKWIKIEKNKREEIQI